jgi:DNA repair protein RecO (recombination protein O)
MATRAARAPATLAAYVLHHYDWSESSLILDLLTREQGRVAVVAKGAKRPYSQMRSVLLPFQRLQVNLGRPPKVTDSGESGGDVQTLRGAEWGGGPSMPTGAALFSGFYLNELLMKLLARGDPHPALFDAYAQTLPTLALNDEATTQAALRAFELTLLRHIGVLPELSTVTLTQQPVREDGRYGLLPDAGVGAVRRGEVEVDGALLIALETALEEGSLSALHQACRQHLPSLRGLLRNLLHYHLGSNVLRTRQVMLDVQALER